MYPGSLGEIVKDCDDLNLQVKPTLLPDSTPDQMGLFAKSQFNPKQIICEVRGPMLKKQHLSKLYLRPNDFVVETYSGLLIHCNSICRFANDIIVKPKTRQQFMAINIKSVKPFKWHPGLKYNARLVMKNQTQNKVFLEACTTIQPGSEIYVKHDLETWFQKFRSQFYNEKDIEDLAEKIKKL